MTQNPNEYLNYMYEEAEEKIGVKSKSKPDPDFYHQNLIELFDVIEIEHETEKAILFHTNKGNFWCPKSMIRMKSKKDIRTWKIWKNFEYKFIQPKKG